MDDLILPAIFVGLVIVVPLLIGCLRHSRAFWVPAVILFVAGGAILSSISPSEHGGSPTDAIGAVGDAIALLFGLFLFAYGAIALLIGGVAFTRHQERARKAALPPPPSPLPMARAL